MLEREEVKHIAGLVKLELSGEEVEKLQKELGRTLEYIKILEELEVEGVEPTSQVTGLRNVLREDKLEGSFTQKEALSEASKKVGGYFKTSSVFK